MKHLKPVSIAIALLLMLGSLTLLHPTIEATSPSFIEDMNSPDATYRDSVWHNDGTFMVSVGNNSYGNGVVDKYNPKDKSWQNVHNISGDSYNGVTNTESFMSYDGFEGGLNGWTTNSWEPDESLSLVGQWRFEEGEGSITADSSENNHHGTLVNMNNTNWVDGIDGKALKFNSANNNYVNVPNVAGLTSGSFSGSCWINLTTHTNFGGIVNNYEGGGWGLWNQLTGTIRFWLSDGTSNTFKDSSIISTSVWHHIAWIYNASSGTALFYIDGKLDFTLASANPSRTISSMTIGKYYTYYLNGLVDEVCNYDYAMTTKEIYDYYNETIHKMGEWKFDENAGGIANDTSQNEFDGALMPSYPSNNPTWLPFAVSGGTLLFDGVDDAVETDYIPNTFNNHDFSIDAWIYPTVNRSDAVIYAIGAANVQDGNLEFKINMGKIEIWHWMDNWMSEIYVNMNEWTHLTYTYTHSTKVGTIYVNSIQMGTHNFIGFLNIYSDAYCPSQIGHGVESRYFKGCIDEVSIYNYTMPSDTVSLNHNRFLTNYFQNESRHMDLRFEESFGAIAYDSGIHGNDGTLVNMDNTNRVDGMSGKALSFNGANEYVTCGNDNSLDITDLGTVEAWVYPRTEGDYLRLVAKGNNYEISMDSSYPHKWYFWVNGGETVTSTSNVNLNNWTHIAATYDGSAIRIYINGMEENVVPKFGVLTPDMSPLSIAQSSGYYFNGSIDEVKIWNRALTPSDILASYRSALNPCWHQINPSILPTPASGTSHGSAKNGNNVWWFGVDSTGDYNDGTRVAGSLVSPSVNLPGISSRAAIIFSHWFDVESGGNYDSMILSIKNTSDSGWCELMRWDSGNTSFSSWRQEIIIIDGWMGNQVQVNFTFDSLTGDSNDYAGWHIDDFILYTNDMYIVVGEPGPSGYSAYAVDTYGTFKNINGMNAYDFNDVAPGDKPLSFMAVGDNGAAEYFNGYSWQSISGASPGEVLTGIDFNGTHFFIVGYDAEEHGVAYYYREGEYYAGQHALHPIWGTPDWKLNAVAWSNAYSTQRGFGMGAVAAEGSAMSFSNPQIWYPINTATAPSPRYGHAMAYDSKNDVIVLFGGFNVIGFDDTWIYNLTTRAWTQVFPATAPSARRFHDMVYDTTNQKMILFGGYPYSSETWAYDYASNTWTKMNPASKPTPRCYHAMVFDSVISGTVLFGGWDGVAKADTWVYDYYNDSWNLKSPATSPTARNNHAMTFDPINERTILFGGQTGSYNGETWAYDAVADSWSNLGPSTAPSARLRHSMAYDAVTKQTILFGGMTGTLSDETWAYDYAANKWTNLFPERRPDALESSDMAFATNRGQAVLFGGSTGGYINKTWHCVPGTPWNGNVVSPAKYTNGENFTAVTWNNAGTDAFFVGHNSTHAVLYTFYHGSDYIAIVPRTEDIFAGHKFYAATCTPKSKTGDLIILGASSFKIIPMMFDSSTLLTVNVECPHIFNVDFREQSTGTSMLDTQVDVGKNYTFFIEGNYTIGGMDMWNAASLSIDAWFDEGRLRANSSAEGSWSTEYNRTRQFRITHDSGSGTTLVYPSVPEFTLGATWEDPVTYAGNRHRIYINITFGNQTRAADGDAFANGGPLSGDIWNLSSALNDPNSWDFSVLLEDPINASAFAIVYGEFGVKRNVVISVSGNPSGSAPPGTFDMPLAINSLVTYSANTAYWVNISIPHLYMNGVVNATNYIGAWNISVSNTHPTAVPANSYIPAQTHFPSAQNTEMNIWGKNATSIGPPGNGSVSAGPWITDYNAGGLGYDAFTSLQWWVTIQAGVPEGVYIAVISITIRS